MLDGSMYDRVNLTARVPCPAVVLDRLPDLTEVRPPGGAVCYQGNLGPLRCWLRGDVLRLRAGDYARGLPMRRSGEEGRCLVVEALDPSARPRFLGSNAFNVIASHGASCG